MKRDMDIVRSMLLEIEHIPAAKYYDTLESSIEADSDVLREHLNLLHDARFVHECDIQGLCKGLTWQGHEFLDAARSDTVWNQVKTTLREAGVSATFDTLQELLVSRARQQLGLN